MQVGGNLRFLAFAGAVWIEEVSLHADQVHDAAEVSLLADGQLHRNHGPAIGAAKSFERALKAGAVAIQLVDHQRAGQGKLFAEAPHFFRLHFDAGDTVNEQQGAIRRFQRRFRFVHKNVVAGCIHEIDFRFSPLRVGQRSADGKLALDFFLVVVRDGRAFVHLPQTICHTRGKEECGN